MTKDIRKRNGSTESFNKEKLTRSISRTGASTETSNMIADSMEIKENMSTDDIRRTVSKKLRETDPGFAKFYDEQRMLKVQRSKDVKNGTILLGKDTMTDLNLRNGDGLEILLGSRIESFRIDRSRDTGYGAHINTRDMESLRIDDGNRVLVRQKVERGDN